MASKTFGVKLREAREERGLTQYALAKQAGITKSFVCRLEKDKIKDPGWSVVQKLAQVLELDCTAFATPQTLPDLSEARGPGRPRKKMVEG